MGNSTKRDLSPAQSDSTVTQQNKMMCQTRTSAEHALKTNTTNTLTGRTELLRVIWGRLLQLIPMIQLYCEHVTSFRVTFTSASTSLKNDHCLSCTYDNSMRQNTSNTRAIITAFSILWRRVRATQRVMWALGSIWLLWKKTHLYQLFNCNKCFFSSRVKTLSQNSFCSQYDHHWKC